QAEILEYYTNGTMAVVAGSGSGGYQDGIGTQAQFANPIGLAVDPAGKVYIGDTANNLIRRGTYGPVILTQPQSQSVGVGTNVSFSVSATATAPLFYQWQYNGANIAGATNATLNLGGADNTKVGNYDVVVSLAQSFASLVSNQVFSATATLAVNFGSGVAGPRLTGQPTGEVASLGGNTTLTAAAVGGAGLTYQWYLNGAAVAGATNTALTLTGAQLSQAGYYTVVISNAGGSVTSQPTPVTVSVPLAVTTVAGLPGVSGSSDGYGPYAQFHAPEGLAADGAGNIYIADTANNTIRLLAPNGQVSTLAGKAGVAGFTNGVGALALFNGPQGVAVAGNGDLYIADTGNDAVRKISGGVV